MKKKTILLSAAAALALALGGYYFAFSDFFMDSNKADIPAENGDGHDGEGEKGAGKALTISNAQLANSGIALHTIKMGGIVEVIVPATVETTPTGSARLDARADGTIRKILKTHGDYVRVGETVAIIESSQAALYSSDIAMANARLSQAQAAYEREKRLYDAKVTARQDLEAAQAQMAIARADYKRAKNTANAAGVTGNGNMIAVTSPIAGRVTNTPALLGSYVTAGTELMRIVDPNRVQVKAALPAKDATRINVDDKAVIRLANGEEIGAKVRSVTPSLDAETRSAIAILTPDRLVPSLQPDAFAEVRILLAAESDPNAINVPEQAVQNMDGKQVVFVRKGETFQPVAVTTGTRSNGFLTILSGVKAGDRIAAENAFLLKAEIEKSEAGDAH